MTTQGFAGSVSSALSIIGQPAVAAVFTPANPIEPCNAAPGALVSALAVTGADRNAVTWNLPGDTANFALSSTNIVAGSGRIASGDCGKLKMVTATGTQQ